jgi:hypothetical protein
MHASDVSEVALIVGLGEERYHEYASREGINDAEDY